MDNSQKKPVPAAADSSSQVFDPALAVALSHDLENENAPRVVAKGKGAFAEQILQLAFANSIKVREDADLVKILSAIDVDSEIPLEAFAAVAEILTYVYYANGEFQKLHMAAADLPGEPAGGASPSPSPSPSPPRPRND